MDTTEEFGPGDVVHFRGDERKMVVNKVENGRVVTRWRDRDGTVLVGEFAPFELSLVIRATRPAAKPYP